MAFRGRVAWVVGGDEPLGRAIALELAGRGVALLVTGRDERELGKTVGEIAYQGGKARHLVADAREPADIEDALAHLASAFGKPDLVVGPKTVDSIALPALPAHVLVIDFPAPTGEDEAEARVFVDGIAERFG